MFKQEIDWEKAHEKTARVVVDCMGIAELDKDGTCLRQHTLFGVMTENEFKRPVIAKVNVNAPANQQMQPPMPACPVTAPQPVALDKHQFYSLLATMKTQATTKNVREDQKLTVMDIHERLLAMVSHD